MSASTVLKLHEAEITQLLGPGERLVALTDFTLADGKRQLNDTPGPPAERSGAQKAGELALGAAVFLVTGPDTPSPGRMLGGVSAAGHAGSWAHQLFEAYRGATNRAPYLMVTNRRLVLISKRIFGKGPEFSVALGIPRDAVLNASRGGKPLARGRVVIDFADGSMMALKFGTFLTGQADRLVGALTPTAH